MMKIDKLRNGSIRARGTLEVITGELQVTIQGPERAWRDLDLSAPHQPKRISSLAKRYFRYIFFHDVILPVLGFLHPRRRGVSYEEKIFTRKMKAYCRYVYLFWECWLKEPRNMWPNLIEEAVSALEKPPLKRAPDEWEIAGALIINRVDQSKRIKRTDIAKLTAFCAEKYFHEEREKYSDKARKKKHFDKWTDNFDTFTRTFIRGNINNHRLAQDSDFYRKHYKHYLASDFKATFESPEPPFQVGKYLSSK